MELMSLLLATLFVAPPVAAPDPEPGMGRDAFGDALPFGAVARYGTIRYRAGGQRQVVFSRDGKTLISDGVGGYLYLWATDTGKLIRRYMAFGPGGHAFARSPDGKMCVTSDPNDKDVILRNLVVAYTGKQGLAG